MVAVAPEHAGSRRAERAALWRPPPLRRAPPSVPQQHGVQHVGCGHKHGGTNISLMIHDDSVHPGGQEGLKTIISHSNRSAASTAASLRVFKNGRECRRWSEERETNVPRAALLTQLSSTASLGVSAFVPTGRAFKIYCNMFQIFLKRQIFKFNTQLVDI